MPAPTSTTVSPSMLLSSRTPATGAFATGARFKNSRNAAAAADRRGVRGDAHGDGDDPRCAPRLRVDRQGVQRLCAVAAQDIGVARIDDGNRRIVQAAESLDQHVASGRVRTAGHRPQSWPHPWRQRDAPPNRAPSRARRAQPRSRPPPRPRCIRRRLMAAARHRRGRPGRHGLQRAHATWPMRLPCSVASSD